MKKEQLYETIEAYLEGKLAAERRRAFEKEMAADPQLRAEVELHRRMQQELGKSGKAKLRAQLRDIAGEFPVQRKRRAIMAWLTPLSGAVAAAIIAAVIWWAWPRSGPSSLPQGPSVAIEDSSGEPAAAPDSLIAVEPGPKPEETTPSAPQQQPAAEPEPPAADPFRPNPQLEGMAATETRDANFLISATVDATTTPSDSFRATIAGTLRAGAPADDARIELQLYDNQLSSFQENRPAASIPLELQRLEDEEVQGFGRMNNYTFEKEVGRELPPGLYYYVIKREGDDAPLFVGKIEVKRED